MYIRYYYLFIFLLLISSCAEPDPYNNQPNDKSTSTNVEQENTSQNTNQAAPRTNFETDNVENGNEPIAETPSSIEPQVAPSDENAYLPDTTIQNGQELIDSHIFASDFENNTTECWGYRPNSGGWNFEGCGGFSNIGKGDSVTLAENTISHSGTKSLKITFNYDEDYGGAEVKFPDSEHIFTRYYDYYDANFDFGFVMKTHRIRSFNYLTDINNFDTVMVSWGQPNINSNYDMTGTNGMRHLSLNYNGGPFNWRPTGNDFNFQRNRWYCIETEVKLNTPNLSDGVVRLWVDGTLHAESVGENIRGSQSSKINLVLFGGWYSNSAAGQNPQPNPAQTSIRYIDDVSISNERIGCRLQ